MTAVNTKTKAVMALGLLDIARQVTRAWAARQRAEEQRLGFGHGLRNDVRQFARDTRERVPSPSQLEWGMPPWRRAPTPAERAAKWWPIAAVIVVSSAAIIAVARALAARDDVRDPEAAVTDSRMVGAIRAGSHAIDDGVAKVVEGSSAAAAGTASAVAGGSTAVRQATVQRAKVELDERVVQPAKRKAVVYGALAFIGLTVYVVILAVAVQLLVAALG
ncbi:MAG: hypothetical protein JWM86_224 [Thermoleophilia bacterium]|nr:hypothetical protein [Thermoleophilia bacterium]